MDYTNWTMDELDRLRGMLAAEGAGAEEIDAVTREIRRRAPAAHPSPEGFAGSGSTHWTIPGEGALVDGYAETNKRQGIAEMEHVGVALRFVALLIDGAVFFVLGFVIALMSGGTSSASTVGTQTAGFHLAGGSFLVWCLISLAYYISCETLLGGTLGKLALGLRVVDEEGGQIKWGASVVRNLLRIVDGLFFYLIGAVAVWSSPARQRLGDRAAHTYVVRP
jgi:uncharacterized RDD family membrane protein YckC